MRFQEALAELDARQPERMVPDLSRITALAELLDHPERTYPTIHVTGTNGKTTTARLIGGIMCAHGLATGVYTSPHLESVRERLALCDEPISEEEFAETYAYLLPYLREVDAEGERVTYFETLTALAYLWFAEKPVNAGVFEVGMGGMWDATNLIASDVAVLCPIGLDHPELGSTVEEVATEKAAIIKEGKVAVSWDQPSEALDVIQARCADVHARLLLEGRDFGLSGRVRAVGGQVVSVRGLHATYDELEIPFFGEHGARGAVAAVVGVEALLDRGLSHDAVREAMAGAASAGRMEVVGRHPLVVLDGAHNPSAARALAAALLESFSWDDLHLVIACSSNKDIEGIVRALAPLATAAYATAHSSSRSADAHVVASVCEASGLAADTFDSVPAALASALEAAGEADLVLVTGSLYTVADARRVTHPHG